MEARFNATQANSSCFHRYILALSQRGHYSVAPAALNCRLTQVFRLHSQALKAVHLVFETVHHRRF